MSYNKHNFVSGNILYATQVKEMDDQIYDLTEADATKATRITKLEGDTTPASDAAVESMLIRILSSPNPL